MATSYVVRPTVEPADGARTVFSMPYQFLPTTLRVLLNGVALTLGEWVELSTTQFKILSMTPRTGDFLEAFFVPL